MDPQSEIERFIDALWIERGLSDNSLSAYRTDLNELVRWLREARGIVSALSVLDAVELQAYLAHRFRQGFSPRSTARLLSCLRSFFRYAIRQNWCVVDPSLDVVPPTLGRALPNTLSESDGKALFEAPRTGGQLVFRVRPVLEL